MKIKAVIPPRRCIQRMPGCYGVIPIKKDYTRLKSCGSPACVLKARQDGWEKKRTPRDIKVQLSVMDLWLMRKIV